MREKASGDRKMFLLCLTAIKIDGCIRMQPSPYLIHHTQ